MVKERIINIKHLFEALITLKAMRNIVNWRDFLSLYINSEKSETQTIFLKSGIKLDIRSKTTDKWALHEIFLRDDYLLQDLNLNNGVIIDIGANIGLFSLKCANMFTKVKIFSYEPEPDNFKLMQNNIRINNLQKMIIPFQKGITNKRKKINLNVFSNHPGGHSIIFKGDRQVKVDSITLNDVFDSNRIQKCSLIKMDIEGSEYEILYNLSDNIFNKVERIHLEYHNNSKDPSNNGKSLKAFLESKGFDVKMSKSFSANHGYLYCLNKSNNIII